MNSIPLNPKKTPMIKAIKIKMPVSDEVVRSLSIGDQLEISGNIFCGRDAVLPQVVKLLDEKGANGLGVRLQGGAIFHTAVSPAGIGPTTSSKTAAANQRQAPGILVAPSSKTGGMDRGPIVSALLLGRKLHHLASEFSTSRRHVAVFCS